MLERWPPHWCLLPWYTGLLRRPRNVSIAFEFRRVQDGWSRAIGFLLAALPGRTVPTQQQICSPPNARSPRLPESKTSSLRCRWTACSQAVRLQFRMAAFCANVARSRSASSSPNQRGASRTLGSKIIPGRASRRSAPYVGIADSVRTVHGFPRRSGVFSAWTNVGRAQARPCGNSTA